MDLEQQNRYKQTAVEVAILWNEHGTLISQLRKSTYKLLELCREYQAITETQSAPTIGPVTKPSGLFTDEPLAAPTVNRLEAQALPLLEVISDSIRSLPLGHPTMAITFPNSTTLELTFTWPTKFSLGMDADSQASGPARSQGGKLGSLGHGNMEH